MVIQCCVCKMVKDGQIWKFDGHGGRGDASHTYCPRCLKQTTKAMKAERFRADCVQPLGA